MANENGSEIIRIINKFVLYNNYPNPFNLATRINYELPEITHINLSIYDVTGRLIRILVNEEQGTGYHSVIWDGRNKNGTVVANGVYFYKLTTVDGYSETNRMILLK